MSRLIEVGISKSESTVLEKVRSAFDAHSIKHTLTDCGGTFDGRGYSGSIHLADGKAVIEITKKPMLIPWGVVENTVRSYFM